MQSSRYGQGSASPGPVRRPMLGITAALAGAGVLALGVAGRHHSGSWLRMRHRQSKRRSAARR